MGRAILHQLLCFAVRLIIQSKSEPEHSVSVPIEVQGFNRADYYAIICSLHASWTLKTSQVTLLSYLHSSYVGTGEHCDYLR